MDAYGLIEGGARAPLLLFAAALAAAMLLEALLPLPARSDFAARRVGNFALGAINLALPYLLGLAGIAALSVANAREGWGLLNAAPLPAPLAIVLGIVLLDLGDYLRHRLSHHIPLLWRCHRVHHSDVEVDATTALRNHPLELFYAVAFTSAVVVIGGIGLAALLIHSVLAVTLNVVGHARAALPARLDATLAALIVTPRVHRMHHSSHQPETDSNFGVISTLWDRLLGTYRPGAPAELGLEDFRGENDSGTLAMLVNPLRRARRPTPETRPWRRGGGRIPGRFPRA